MVSINQAMRSVKDDLAELLEPRSIFAICGEVGHVWRRCVLDPSVIIYLFVMQILSCNTACTDLCHRSGLTFTASAYCQARKRLPLKVIQSLVRRICDRLSGGSGVDCLWRGHRVWRLDGSSASMPDTPELQSHFGQPAGQKAGCGFPMASTLSLMHVGTGFLIDLLVRPMRAHDASGIVRMHEQLKRDDVLLADRGFCSYTHLSLLLEGSMHAVFRLHQRIKVNFQPHRRCQRDLPYSQRKGQATSRYVRKLGHDDQVVEYFKPGQRPTWIEQEQFDALPASIQVRELRYRVHQRGFRSRQIVIVTTLLDPEAYPSSALAELYGDRWQIEVDFRHMKTTMGMDVLHCKTVDGVLKELWMYMLVYNLVRQVMLKAARAQDVPPDRISFIDAMRWLQNVRLGHGLILLIVNPLRTGRFEPRLIKRRMKEYSLMTKPRRELRQEIANS